MKLKVISALTLFICFGAQAQMPESFSYKMEIDVDPNHSKIVGSIACLNSAKVLVPSEVLRAKFSQNFSCSILTPLNNSDQRNAMCVTTTDIDHGTQYVTSGAYDIATGSFRLFDKVNLNIANDPSGYDWIRIVAGKRGTKDGAFIIRAVKKSERMLAELNGTSIDSVPFVCELTLPTQNEF